MSNNILNKINKLPTFIKVIITLILIVIIMLIINILMYPLPLGKKVTDREWIGIDSEGGIIYFSNMYEFGYYEYSGNSIEDYDLCNFYSYNPLLKRIKLHCFFSGDTVTVLKIVKSTKEELILDFNGEIRTFHSKEYYEKLKSEDGPEFKGKKFISDSDENIVIEFLNNGNYIAYNKKTNEKGLYSDTCPKYEYKYNEDDEDELYLICNNGIKKRIEIAGSGSSNTEEYLSLSYDFYDIAKKFGEGKAYETRKIIDFHYQK